MAVVMHLISHIMQREHKACNKHFTEGFFFNIITQILTVYGVVSPMIT